MMNKEASNDVILNAGSPAIDFPVKDLSDIPRYVLFLVFLVRPLPDDHVEE